MISVEKADKIIFQDVSLQPAIAVALQDAFGCVLREDIIADRDLPPFDRVTMDGIAIISESFAKGNRTFAIEGVQKAGSPALCLKEKNGCIEVMTGAVLPEGCDCVVPVEQIAINQGLAELNEGYEPVLGQNIHPQASDGSKGACLVKRGCRLNASRIAAAASAGKSQVLVSRPPKVAVVGTGDEVVAIDEAVEPHQIRRSNAYAIESMLKCHGCGEVTRFHIRDDLEELKKGLVQILADHDILVLIGGVSMGKFDYVPEALAAIGVKQLFHKVRQRPGKPFWFGKSKAGKPVFALPGNPVSAHIGTRRYVLAFLERAMGVSEEPVEWVILDRDIEIKTEFMFFLPVIVRSQTDGYQVAEPIFMNNSGDYKSLVCSDGFVELPADTLKFEKGMPVHLYRW